MLTLEIIHVARDECLHIAGDVLQLDSELKVPVGIALSWRIEKFPNTREIVSAITVSE